MSLPRVIIRCDGGRNIGLGHVVRCLALADMLRDDFEILFALQETSEEVYAWIRNEGFSILILPSTEDFKADLHSLLEAVRPGNIVVLDGYAFKSDYQKSIRDIGCKIVAIDDLHAWHHYADVVINHAGGVRVSDYDCEVYTQLLLGYEYILLRKEFFQIKRTQPEPGELKTFFVSMGASDVGGQTIKITEALLTWPSLDKMVLMLSSLNPHLDRLRRLESAHIDRIEIQYNLNAAQLIKAIESSQVVVSPASSISFESCAVGRYLMTGYTASNQLSIYHGLIQSGMAADLGDFNDLTKEDFLKKLTELNEQPEKMRMIDMQHQRINSGAVKKIRNAFQTMINSDTTGTLAIRRARMSDLALYFQWVNDPEVRRNSFNSNPVSIEDHTSWFVKQLHSAASVMFLFLQKDIPIGQVRFLLEGDTALLNFSIEKQSRGKGFAAQIITIASSTLKDEYPMLKKIVAEVKPENMASGRAFERAGYHKQTEDAQKIVYHLEWR